MTPVEIMMMGMRRAGRGGDHMTGTGGNTLRGDRGLYLNLIDILKTVLPTEGKLSKITKQKKY